MDDAAWSRNVAAVDRAAEDMLVLARCLAVQPQLTEWRRTGDEAMGGDAANALDQARGLLDLLAAGGAADLVARLDAVLDQLPPAWD